MINNYRVSCKSHGRCDSRPPFNYAKYYIQITSLNHPQPINDMQWFKTLGFTNHTKVTMVWGIVMRRQSGMRFWQLFRLLVCRPVKRYVATHCPRRSGPRMTLSMPSASTFDTIVFATHHMRMPKDTAISCAQIMLGPTMQRQLWIDLDLGVASSQDLASAARSGACLGDRKATEDGF